MPDLPVQEPRHPAVQRRIARIARKRQRLHRQRGVPHRREARLEAQRVPLDDLEPLQLGAGQDYLRIVVRITEQAQ